MNGVGSCASATVGAGDADLTCVGTRPRIRRHPRSVHGRPGRMCRHPLEEEMKSNSSRALRRVRCCHRARRARRRTASHVHDRPAGRIVDSARRRAQEHVGEGDSGPADPAAARRRHRQRPRRRRRQGADRLRQLGDHRRRRRGPRRRIRTRRPRSARSRTSIRSTSRWSRWPTPSQLVRRPEGQVAGHAAQGQHRGNADRRASSSSTA